MLILIVLFHIILPMILSIPHNADIDCRSSSKDRSARAKTPQEANEPFDKYFSGPFGASSAAAAAASSSNGSQPTASSSSRPAPAPASYMRRY